jgi:trk system potassium uptake protein TrkA
MRIVILGAGMIGINIARELIDEKREVVLIEKDPEVAGVASNELDCIVINDDGSKPEVLRRAGTSRADWFLALTGSDEVNIVSCGLVAAESSEVRTVARVENAFYSSLSPVQKQAFGLDVLVNPAQETADAVIKIIEEGFAEDVVPLLDGRLQLRYITAAPHFQGKTLREIRSNLKEEFLVAAVVRNKVLSIPDGDYQVEEDDGLYILGTPTVLDRVIGPVAGMRQTAKQVLVVGATKIGELLVSGLRERGRAKGLRGIFRGRRSVTVLDSSKENGKRLARLFEGVDIVQGDSSEEGVLEKAGADKADLVVCASESQTFNILTAQLAKTMGAAKSIAIALNDRYKPLSSTLDVDALVSVKSVVAAAVLELVRKAHIRTIHDFFEDDVEIVELSVGQDSPAVGKPLKLLDIPKGVLVGFALQGDRAVVPTGSMVVSGGDVVAFIARKGSITGIEQVFGGERGE